MAKSIKKNFIFNILLNLSKVIFPLITAPYVARVLAPEGVGLYNFAIIYVGYFALFAVLGVATYGVRETARLRDDKDGLNRFVSEIISIELFLTILVSIIFLATLFVIPQLNKNFEIFLVAGITLYTSPFIIDWYYKGIEDFKFITIRSLLIKTLSILALFVFVKTRDDLIIYVLIYSLANVANEVWNFIVLYKCGIYPHITTRGLKQHMKPLLILFLSSIAISIYTTLDTLMLGFISNYSEVGFYNNATHISRALLMVITSLAIVAMPRISYYIANGNVDEINKLIEKSVSIISFLAFPLSFSLLLISPTFVPLFFGNDFVGTIAPMQILSLLLVIIGFNNLTGTQILLSYGCDKPFLYSVIAGTISNFILNLALIPLLGAIGASIASVFAEAIVLIVSIVYVRKSTNIHISSWSDVYKCIVGLIGIYTGYIISSVFTAGWIQIIVFAVIGTSFYFIIEAVLKNTVIENGYTMIQEKIKTKR